MRTLKGSLAIFFVMSALVGPALARSQNAVVVGTDAAGDWKLAGAAASAPLGAALGQDLVSASIEPRSSEIVFSIGVTSLPKAEGELTGIFSWDFGIGDKSWRITNLPCDPSEWVPTPGSIPDPDPFACEPSFGPLLGFDLLECGGPRVVNVVYNCEWVATVPVQLDATSKTINITVARDLLDTTGMTIRPAGSFSRGDVSVTLEPAGSAGSEPADIMRITRAVNLN